MTASQPDWSAQALCQWQENLALFQAADPRHREALLPFLGASGKVLKELFAVDAEPNG